MISNKARPVNIIVIPLEEPFKKLERPRNNISKDTDERNGHFVP